MHRDPKEKNPRNVRRRESNRMWVEKRRKTHTDCGGAPGQQLEKSGWAVQVGGGKRERRKAKRTERSEGKRRRVGVGGEGRRRAAEGKVKEENRNERGSDANGRRKQPFPEARRRR